MGSFPESELKKIAEDYSFIGGSEKEFMNIFNQSRQKPFDFLYINVPRLEAYRNYDELIWSSEMNQKKNVEDLDKKINVKNDE
jgi:hypothetical protein